MTAESTKVGSATTAVRSKPLTSADGKKASEKKEAIKKTPVKKDSAGLLAF